MKITINRPPPVQQPPISVTLTLSWEDFVTLVSMTGLAPVQYKDADTAYLWQQSNWHQMDKIVMGSNEQNRP